MHLSHDAHGIASLVEHQEPDEVGDVVGVGRERGEILASYAQLGSASDRAVELDRAASTAHLARQRDACRLAVGVERRADLEALRVLARLLDDERAVDPVRPPDPPDTDELGQSAISSR
jgi:hypothetical protein